MSLGEYIRRRFSDERIPKRRTRGKHPVKYHVLLSYALGGLERSRLANNLNQLAKAANMENLVLTPETKTALLEACADIREMRDTLMRTLGLNKD